MNRAWMAMAGLVAVGAAAVVADRYLPSSIAAREATQERATLRAVCRKVDTILAPGDPAVRRAAQHMLAFMLATGLCGQQDVAAAHGIFREAIARPGGDDVFVWYYLALDAIGDVDGKRNLLIPAAAAVAAIETGQFIEFWDRMPRRWENAELYELSQRMIIAIRGTDAAIALDIVRLLGARAFETQAVESRVLLAALDRLRPLDLKEGAYWGAHLSRTGRRPFPRSMGTIFSDYTTAARCGHVEAIRERAQYWLDVDVPIRESDRAHVVGSVARLHERTAQEQALLDAVVAKSGISVERALSGELFPTASLDNPTFCYPLRMPDGTIIRR